MITLKRFTDFVRAIFIYLQLLLALFWKFWSSDFQLLYINISLTVWIIFYKLSINIRAVNNMPNIFECLEADVLGGRLGSKKWVQANFNWPKFSEVGIPKVEF